MSCRATSSIDGSLAADGMAIMRKQLPHESRTAMLTQAFSTRGMSMLREMLLKRGCHREHGSRKASWCQQDSWRCLLPVTREDSVSIRSAKQRGCSSTGAG